MDFRSLAQFVTQLVGRSQLAEVAGHTYGGKRDVFKALGYKKALYIEDYWGRFRRNAVANRVVKAAPATMWHGGPEITDTDGDPDDVSPFEQQFAALAYRLRLWPMMYRADVLAGIGRFAVLLIGAPGELDTPLVSCKADDIIYLRAYSEIDTKIFRFDLDPASPRFGMPELYNISRTTMLTPESTNSNVVAKVVHYSRVIHIAEGELDDMVYGEPRLHCIWNDLDDLEKVKGGGSEAFWRRADGGTQFDLDPTIDFGDEENPGASTADATTQAKNLGVQKQIDEMEHGLRKNLLTRGIKIQRMGSDVADFGPEVSSIISCISAGTGIPQRVLTGSEQGKLAAKQDSATWDNRVIDRQHAWAEPCVVRPFIDRMIAIGALPAPENGYEVRWPTIVKMDDEQRANIATKLAELNKLTGETVITGAEIRTRVLDLEALTDAEEEDEDATWLRAQGAEHLSYNERRTMCGYDEYTGNVDVDPYQDVPIGLLPKFAIRVTDPNVPSNAPGGSDDPGAEKGALPGAGGAAPAASGGSFAAAARKRGARSHVHDAADTFRTSTRFRYARSVQYRKEHVEHEQARTRVEEPQRAARDESAEYGIDRLRRELEG